MSTTASRLPQPRRLLACLAGVLLLGAAATHVRAEVPAPTAQEAAEWHLADKIPMPKDNESTPERAELGKALFFDPRLSGSQTMSCASCHQPTLGWADGHKTAVLLTGEVLGRASPTMLNLAYNTQFMWDGRKKSLEDQAEGPHKHLSTVAYKAAAAKLGAIPGYREMFDKAYPGEPMRDPRTMTQVALSAARGGAAAIRARHAATARAPTRPLSPSAVPIAATRPSPALRTTTNRPRLSARRRCTYARLSPQTPIGHRRPARSGWRRAWTTRRARGRHTADSTPSA